MKNSQIDYEKILTVIEKTFLDSNFYWQSLSLVACFIVAYFLYRVSRKSIFPNIRFIKRDEALNRFFKKYTIPLLYPLFALTTLSIGLSVYAQFFKETILFATTAKLMALFLFLRFLRLSTDNNFIANVAGIFLMPALILDTFNLFEPVIAYLDQYSLKVGKVKISIYLVLKGFVLLLIVFWFCNLIGKKSKLYIERNKNIKTSTKSIINKLIDIVVYSIIVIVMLKTFGVDLTTFAVIGGAVGVGIGFGLQKIASNFISGVILLFEKTVEIGDIVELDDGKISGTVKHFSGRYTLIEGWDGKEILVPNEEFIVNKVGNWTHSNNRARVEINVGISYKSDFEKVREIMMNCAREHPRCISYPETDCFVTELADSHIRFTLHFWVSDVTKGRLIPKSEVSISILKEFQKNNIVIALPQREIKMVS